MLCNLVDPYFSPRYDIVDAELNASTPMAATVATTMAAANKILDRILHIFDLRPVTFI